MGSSVSVSNRLLTEVPFQMFRIACANIGAVGTLTNQLGTVTTTLGDQASEVVRSAADTALEILKD